MSPSLETQNEQLLRKGLVTDLIMPVAFGFPFSLGILLFWEVSDSRAVLCGATTRLQVLARQNGISFSIIRVLFAYQREVRTKGFLGKTIKLLKWGPDPTPTEHGEKALVRISGSLMRPFFSRKLWESIFLLTLQNVFRTGSVHWSGLFFLLFCFASVDMTSYDCTVKLNSLVDTGTFCPNSSCVRSSCFPATYKHGHTGFSETQKGVTLQPFPWLCNLFPNHWGCQQRGKTIVPHKALQLMSYQLSE